MESLEVAQTRHRKEQRDLQSRITNKKKSATKKTRKAINDECAELERQLREKQEHELAGLTGQVVGDGGDARDEENAAHTEDEERSLNGDEGTNTLTEQLESTMLSQTASPASQAQPKKRNRQKERLARRAAEQEAAAVKAEEEASTMVDHRKIEKTYMLNEFKANSLTEKEIRPDGHCLFSAIADQLQLMDIPLRPDGKETARQPYEDVRGAAAGYMESHADDFAPFLEEPLKDYATKIRETAEWGGQLELVALANTYNVQIRVIQDGRTENIDPTEKADSEPAKVWLAYYKHGYGLGEHYNSLRKAP